MIKHIVMWKLNETSSVEDKEDCKQRFKEAIESMQSCMDGILSLEVITKVVGGSNMDLMLLSEFTDEAVLSAYQVHPDHVVAGLIIKPFVEVRSCVDYRL